MCTSVEHLPPWRLVVCAEVPSTHFDVWATNLMRWRCLLSILQNSNCNSASRSLICLILPMCKTLKICYRHIHLCLLVYCTPLKTSHAERTGYTLSAAATEIISSKSFFLQLGLHWNILNSCHALQSVYACHRCSGSSPSVSGWNCNQRCAIYRPCHPSQDRRIWPRYSLVSCEIRLRLSSFPKAAFNRSLMKPGWHKINPLSQPLLSLVTSVTLRWRPVQSLRICALWTLIWRRVKIKAEKHDCRSNVPLKMSMYWLIRKATRGNLCFTSLQLLPCSVTLDLRYGLGLPNGLQQGFLQPCLAEERRRVRESHETPSRCSCRRRCGHRVSSRLPASY